MCVSGRWNFGFFLRNAFSLSVSLFSPVFFIFSTGFGVFFFSFFFSGFFSGALASSASASCCPTSSSFVLGSLSFGFFLTGVFF